MEIKLELQEIWLLQKTRQQKLTKEQFYKHKQLLVPLINHNLMEWSPRDTFSITQEGEAALNKHLPIEDIKIPVYQTYRRR